MLNTKMIGSKIAGARKKTNISQAQLAQRLFISAQAVGKWERGESMPDIVTFSRLAEILGVDLNYFSENFESEAAKLTPIESPSAKQENKPVWDMSLSNWVDADFSGLKNLNEKFSSSNMQRCKFIGSDLSGLLLKNNNLDSCDFSGSNISNSHIRASNLDNNLFKSSSFKDAKILKSYIKYCDFSDSDISDSQIQSSHLSNNLFKGCSLKETEFLKSYIEGSDFSGSDFTGMSFKSGGFENNKVSDAVWNRTSFIGTHIADIVFDGTLEDCYFENCVFNWVKFENATLINTFFKNNTFKRNRIKFTDCKADRITYEFLKHSGTDLTGITLLTS